MARTLLFTSEMKAANPHLPGQVDAGLEIPQQAGNYSLLTELSASLTQSLYVGTAPQVGQDCYIIVNYAVSMVTTYSQKYFPAVRV